MRALEATLPGALEVALAAPSAFFSGLEGGPAAGSAELGLRVAARSAAHRESHVELGDQSSRTDAAESTEGLSSVHQV